MNTEHSQIRIIFWSQAGKTRSDPRLAQPQEVFPAELSFEPEGRFYVGRVEVPESGTLLMDVHSPRPLRLWIAENLKLDEGLYWRWFERSLWATIILPSRGGEVEFLLEAGPRPGLPEFAERDCLSRNREKVLLELERMLPDRLDLHARFLPGVEGPALTLRWLRSQFQRDGVIWQHVLAKSISSFTREAPSVEYWSPAEVPEEPLLLRTNVFPGNALEITSIEERSRGWRRFAVPVSNPIDSPAPLREVGKAETRAEPVIEVARMLTLSIESDGAEIELEFPGFESLGRNAPAREFRSIHRSAFRESKPTLPKPLLPPRLSWMEKLYWYAWEMLHDLIREQRPESGLPTAYVATAGTIFPYQQFVWDSSFTAMATAYGWRSFPHLATLDLLYSRQFDGGYLHREYDTRDGIPLSYEPDFSPNPPIVSVAEWKIASLSGDKLRLAKVYPLLADWHRWLAINRRLPYGTYWTTGLASGLDNSPSLGDEYPCLTAQMAQDAEVLGKMARLLGRDDEAAAWEAEHKAIGRALNERLWNEEKQIYSTLLPGGEHNPNKIVTAFWPLWAGIVPPDRVNDLANHLKDTKSFWRHHPIPSLAADSPHYRPTGDYWLGSTWAPTNYAAIKGFVRAGRRDLAFETTVRHLKCMGEVLESTGHIWENYCPEKSERGNWSGPDYCWSSLGPIAMLFEIVLGFEPDALTGTLYWTLPDEESSGVSGLALGPATVSVECRNTGEGRRSIRVSTDQPFKLEILYGSEWQLFSCPQGNSQFALEIK